MAGGPIKECDPDAPLAEINVTPLVDVMLVLLVIFMLAAPLMAQALKVDLPQAAAPPEAEPVVLTLVIRNDGVLELNQQELPPEQLREQLTTRIREKPDTVLRLGADAATPYQKVAEVLSLAETIGIRRISFATRAP